MRKRGPKGSTQRRHGFLEAHRGVYTPPRAVYTLPRGVYTLLGGVYTCLGGYIRSDANTRDKFVIFLLPYFAISQLTLLRFGAQIG